MGKRRKIIVKALVGGESRWVHVCYIDRAKYNQFFRGYEDVMPWLKTWAERDGIEYTGRTSTLDGIIAFRDAVVKHQCTAIEPIIGSFQGNDFALHYGTMFRTWIENHIEEELKNGTATPARSDP